MKIAILTQSHSLTGVPLAQIRFARALVEQGHQVELVYGKLDPESQPDPPPGVRVVDLGRLRVREMVGVLCRYLSSTKPDVVFSAEDHLTGTALLAAILVRSKAKISGSSRVSPFDTYSNTPFTKGWVFKQFMRAVMWRADALTCVSQDMVLEYRTFFKNAPHVCVYNIIIDQHAVARMQEAVDHPWFNEKDVPILVAAGTLTVRKGFSDLVCAVAEVRRRDRPVRLAILGEGPLKDDLLRLGTELGIADIIWLPGRVSNPLKYFARGDISVLSSYAEGLPNVLVEAMMCGCTPVATDCPTGPREVLHGGKYGYLVEVGKPASIAAGIERALDQPIDKTLLEEAVRPFEVKAVLKRHFEVLGLDQRPTCRTPTEVEPRKRQGQIDR